MSCTCNWDAKGDSVGKEMAKAGGGENESESASFCMIISEITQLCFLGYSVQQQQSQNPACFEEEVMLHQRGLCLHLWIGYCQHDIVSKVSGWKQFSLTYLQSTVCQTAMFSCYLGYFHVRSQVCYYRRFKQTF